MTTASAYRLLGASPEDSDSTLKRKYRRCIRENHPDADPDQRSLRSAFQRAEKSGRLLCLPQNIRSAHQFCLCRTGLPGFRAASLRRAAKSRCLLCPHGLPALGRLHGFCRCTGPRDSDRPVLLGSLSGDLRDVCNERSPSVPRVAGAGLPRAQPHLRSDRGAERHDPAPPVPSAHAGIHPSLGLPPETGG